MLVDSLRGVKTIKKLSFLFPNCTQKAVMSARFSWDVGLKKPRPKLLMFLFSVSNIKKFVRKVQIPVQSMFLDANCKQN